MITSKQESSAFAAWRRRLQKSLIRHAGLSLLILGITSNVVATGCANIQIRSGQRPNTEVLEKSLQPGVSTPADVLSVLGEPFGKGRMMFPIDPKPRTMWSYYYMEGAQKDDQMDARAIYLFVYFDRGRYDGYMWFSSLPR